MKYILHTFYLFISLTCLSDEGTVKAIDKLANGHFVEITHTMITHVGSDIYPNYVYGSVNSKLQTKLLDMAIGINNYVYCCASIEIGHITFFLS